MSSAKHDDMRAATSTIVVIVVRTGGIAGMRRVWRAEPPPPEEPRWIALIERCPWDAAPADDKGADRFVWSIEAHFGPEAKEARLPDRDVQGPWRELVDQVRSFEPPGASTPDPTPSPAPGPEPRPR